MLSSKIFRSFGELLTKGPLFVSSAGPSGQYAPVRFASKKASGGGNKNRKQAPGKHRGIKKWEGVYVYPGDVLVYRQPRLWFFPGLNVSIGPKYCNLVALKEGTVRITTEKPDVNFNDGYMKLFYSEMEGIPFFKKHFNVIPKPQHTRFKCIDQV